MGSIEAHKTSVLLSPPRIKNMACRGEVGTNTDIEDCSFLNDNCGVWVFCIIVGIHWSAPVMWVVLIIAIEPFTSWKCHWQSSPAFLPAQSNPSPVTGIKPLCLDSVTVHWVIHYWHQFPCFISAPSYFRASSVSAWRDPSRGQRVNPSWTGT